MVAEMDPTTARVTMNKVSREVESQVARRRFNQHRPLMDFLPLTFENGEALAEINVTCAACHKHTLPEWTRGEFVPRGKGYEVRSVGLCEPCMLYTYGASYVWPHENTFTLQRILTKIDKDAVPQSPWPEDRAYPTTRRGFGKWLKERLTTR